MTGERETASDTRPLITLEKLSDGYRQISGIAGQVVKAFRAGLISSREAQDKLQELFEAGRINRKIHAALTAAVRQGG